MRTPLPELLAPAGSFDLLMTAVAAGADAVYLSGKKFGARRYAANFNDDELRRAVAYCHLRGVRVYVTLNVLVRDEELAEVARRLLWLYRLGVDAVLVQDAGVAALARHIVPGLPVHASTQMTVHSREGVCRAAEMGMERVVLARELPLEEIEDIAAHIPRGTGLEIFVHGALCYSYSGQCLFSSMVGGRSGNRGMCAQPCRKPYRLVSGATDSFGRPVRLRSRQTEGAYLLSPRDLAVYRQLDRVARAPVESLKIEGRMRSEAYVKTVVDVYRRALDATAQGTWTPSDEEELALLLAFNRGFTRGYLLGARGGALMGPDRPGNRGVRIGTVADYDPRRRRAIVRIEGRLALEPGDGIVIGGGEGEPEVGMFVQRLQGVKDGLVALPVPKAVKPGWAVSLTRRDSLTGTAPAPRPPLPVDLSFSLHGRVPVVEAQAVTAQGGVVSVRRAGSVPMEPARTHPLSADRLGELLSRSGDSPFAVRQVAMHYEGGLFVPLSEITALRRAVLKDLETALIAAWQPGTADLEGAEQRCKAWHERLKKPVAGTMQREAAPPLLSAYADTIDGIRGAVEGGCRRVYFEPTLREDGCGFLASPDAFLSTMAGAADVCRAGGAELVWKWPRICRRAFLDRAIPLLGKAGEAGVSGLMVEDAGAATAVRMAGCTLPVHGSVGLNVWNHLAAGAQSDLFSALTLSPELDAKHLGELVRRIRAHLPHPALEYLVQGPAELMVTEDSLITTALGRNADDGGPKKDDWWGVQDERGYTFPVRTDCEGRTHIFNAVETCLVDHMPALLAIGFDGLAIDARGRTAVYARDMASFYAEAIETVLEKGAGVSGRLKSLKKRIRERAMGGITTGHFLKGPLDE
jgi:putative protease